MSQTPKTPTRKSEKKSLTPGRIFFWKNKSPQKQYVNRFILILEKLSRYLHQKLHKKFSTYGQDVSLFKALFMKSYSKLAVSWKNPIQF